jgi:hypothetical protein
VRRRYTQEKKAAIAVQRAWRDYAFRKRVEVALERGRNRAACSIQSWWRAAITSRRAQTLAARVPPPDATTPSLVLQPQRQQLSTAAAAAMAAQQQQQLQLQLAAPTRPATLEERLRMVRERQRQILNRFQQEKQQQMILTHLVTSEGAVGAAVPGPHVAGHAHPVESPLLASNLSSPHPPRPRPPLLERRGRCNLFELGLPRITDDDGSTLYPLSVCGISTV